MKVYLVYGMHTRYYDDFDSYSHGEIEDVKIYGIYTNKENAKYIAEDIDKNVMEIELDTFLNDQRESTCIEGCCEKFDEDEFACDKCGFQQTLVNDSGITLNEE